jgi:hypothetical protein
MHFVNNKKRQKGKGRKEVSMQIFERNILTSSSKTIIEIK